MLELIPLCTAVVDVGPSLNVGNGPAGGRSVGHFLSATLEGEKIRATLASPAGADWMIRNGAIGAIDVRMTVRTDDDALIHITYNGRLDLSDPAAGIFAYVAPLFETGDDRYAWLNAVQAVGKGKLSIGQGGSAQLTYEFFQLR